MWPVIPSIKHIDANGYVLKEKYDDTHFALKTAGHVRNGSNMII